MEAIRVLRNEVEPLRRVLGILSVILLSACATDSPESYGTDPSVRMLRSAELPTPDPREVIGQSRPYILGPFDKLSIDVFGIEELSKREVQTDASGRISFPLAGVVEAGGKTPGELERLLEDKLRAAHIRDPQVTVNLKETVSQVVTVDGEVKEPGLYPVVGNMTLIRTVATAKGLSDMASRNRVVVFRTVDGQKYAALYDLNAIRHGAYPDPAIYPNDVVIVGESKSRQLFQMAATGAAALSPVILLLQAATR
ncbi:polysaccharide export protein [Tsuneonella flava]|uniref:Polysaccharide export protein n=2 Tax=Tsuneonella flava TaxID=2055955 RepID=A0ABX7KEW9_9SPHN|nr:polysaccharide export protein [Tsuneonella flava]